MSDSRKRVCILGSTGSIGKTTLQVIRDHPDRYRVVGLSARGSADELARQIEEFRPVGACLTGSDFAGSTPSGTRIFKGEKGLLELLESCEPDLVVLALVGAAGLLPTLKTIEMGKTVALANKEVLVMAGELTMKRARERGVAILPIDSEHNAIFQCLQGHESAPLRRIILTASGGPFRGWNRERLKSATLEQALKHPTWTMGRKITIDSATLMNKGFEVIEGSHLFGAPVDRIEVIVHPQSVVHSMVEFADGSMLAQLGVTDMYFPIANVLSYPTRLPNVRFAPLDFSRLAALTFEDYDREAFPCLGYAYESARRGGTYPVALNAANEIAVQGFLDGKIKYHQIAETIDAALQSHTSISAPNLEAILEADRQTREKTAAQIGEFA